MDRTQKVITYFQLLEQEKRALYLFNSSSELLKDKQFAPGYAHILILQEDGSVSAFGSNEYGQCDVSGWTDVIKVAAGDYYSVALKRDGTVLATGDNRHGQCNVGSWENIVDIFAEKGLTVGVKADGSVLFSGSDPTVSDNDGKQSPRTEEVEITPVNEFFYKKEKSYNGDWVYITGYLGNRTEIRIPPIIDGCPVSKISCRAFAESPKLTKIVLPETLKEIASEAFLDCTGLKMILIPDSVWEIGRRAFFGCKELTEITLPRNLRYLYSEAFCSCPKLKNIMIPMSIRSQIDSGSLGEALDCYQAINMILI